MRWLPRWQQEYRLQEKKMPKVPKNLQVGRKRKSNLLILREEPDYKTHSVSSIGKKNDQDKIDYWKIPPKALSKIAQVFDLGAKKYGEDNWKHLEPRRLYSATIRHIESWRAGNNAYDIDESGYHHLAHAAASLIMMLEIESSKSLDI